MIMLLIKLYKSVGYYSPSMIKESPAELFAFRAKNMVCWRKMCWLVYHILASDGRMKTGDTCH